MPVEITEEMVERFHRAYQRNDWPVLSGGVATRIREGLDAALNPPPEPEIRIPVTDEMVAKARRWKEIYTQDQSDYSNRQFLEHVLNPDTECKPPLGKPICGELDEGI